MDIHGYIIDISPHHINNFGKNKISKEEYLKCNIFDYPSVKNTGRNLKYKKVLSGEVLDERNIYFPETTSGSSGYCNIKASPIVDATEIIGDVIIHENITEQTNKTKEL